jgi:hypothetical protein
VSARCSRGLTLLADAAVRVVTAYTLPVDVVPGFNGVLWAVLFLALQVVGNVYFHRAGLYRLLFTRPNRPENREGNSVPGGATVTPWAGHADGRGIPTY